MHLYLYSFPKTDRHTKAVHSACTRFSNHFRARSAHNCKPAPLATVGTHKKNRRNTSLPLPPPRPWYLFLPTSRTGTQWQRPFGRYHDGRLPLSLAGMWKSFTVPTHTPLCALSHCIADGFATNWKWNFVSSNSSSGSKKREKAG